MTRTRRRAESDAGFTLVEVLVAVALIAMVLATIAATYRFGRQAWERVEDMDKAASVASVQSFIAELLQGTFPVIETTPQAGEKLIFEGEPHYVRFVANTQGQTTVGGLYVFEIGEEASEGRTESKDLVVRQVLYRTGGMLPLVKGSEVRQRAVLRNVSGLSLRYFGAPDGSDRTSWTDSWRSIRVLPSLVELRVQFAAGDARSWPQLIAELRLK